MNANGCSCPAPVCAYLQSSYASESQKEGGSARCSFLFTLASSAGYDVYLPTDDAIGRRI